MENNKINLPEEIKKLICKLSDIKHCSVVCGQNNEITEINVLAGINRNVKQLVRDIQSAISAKFGIDIDYKKISIAQINETDLREVRLKLNGVSVKNIDNSIEATVTLTFEDSVFEGKASWVKARNNKYRAIAEATLAAVESYLGMGRTFYLEDVRVIEVSCGQLYACVVGYALSGKEELLSGCILDDADEYEAAAKAVLSAVNRKVSIIG